MQQLAAKTWTWEAESIPASSARFRRKKFSTEEAVQPAYLCACPSTQKGLWWGAVGAAAVVTNTADRGAVAKAPEVGPNATSIPAQGAACWARISTFRASQLLLVLFRASLELQQPNSASDSLPVWCGWGSTGPAREQASSRYLDTLLLMAHNWTWSTLGQLQRGEIPTRGLAGNPASAESKRGAYHSSIPPVLLCLPDPWVLIRISSCSQMQKVRESFLQGHSYHRSYKWLQWHQLLSLTVLLCQARQR